MSSKKDPRIAEMGAAIFNAIGSPSEFNEMVFISAFAKEAGTRGIRKNKQSEYKTPENTYYNDLLRWVKAHVIFRINRRAKYLAKKAKQECRRTKKSVISTPGRQLRLF